MRLNHSDRVYASRISETLKHLYRQPSSQRSHIQSSDNNEIKNIAGWIKLIGLPDDATQIAIEMGNKIVLGEDPLLVHNKAWIQLMLSMERNK